MSCRRWIVTPDLDRIEVPGAAEAEERAARVVAAAFADSPPRHRPRRAARPIAAVAVAVVLIAAVLSPPGRAFVDHVRRAVGVDHARPALFTLPAPGRILVTAGSGTWVTYADGSRRLLGAYDDASWSPFGRYIAATRPNELVTLDPEGTVRWTLARPGVRFPRWTRQRHQHAHRLPQRQPAPRRRGRRQGRLRGRRRTRRRHSTRVELEPRVHPRLRRHRRSPSCAHHREGRARCGARRHPGRRSRSSGRVTAGSCSSSRPAGSRSSTAAAATSSPVRRRPT